MGRAFFVFAALLLFTAWAEAATYTITRNEPAEEADVSVGTLNIPEYLPGDILVIAEGITLEDDDWTMLRKLKDRYQLQLNDTTTAIPKNAFNFAGAEVTRSPSRSVSVARGVIAPFAAVNGCSIAGITAYKVTEVALNAFLNCALLTEAALPDATRIGDYAFKGCTALRKVVLSDDILTNLEKEMEGGEGNTISVSAGKNASEKLDIFGVWEVGDLGGWINDFSPYGNIVVYFSETDAVLKAQELLNTIRSSPAASPVILPSDIEFCTVELAKSVDYIKDVSLPGMLKDMLFFLEEDGEETLESLDDITLEGGHKLFLSARDKDFGTIILWGSSNSSVIDARWPNDDDIGKKSRNSKEPGGVRAKGNENPEFYVGEVKPGAKTEKVTLTALICKFDPVDPSDFATGTYAFDVTVKGTGSTDDDDDTGKKPDNPGTDNPPAVTGVSLSLSSANMAAGGDPIALTATVTPAGAASVTWLSSDPGVAKVRASGGNTNTVEAVAAGTAVIVATAGGKTALCKVTVLPAGGAFRLDASKKTLEPGGSFTLTVLGDVDDPGAVTWKSSHPDVASVPPSGGSVAVKAGQAEGVAVITASSGEKKDFCVVTVSSQKEGDGDAVEAIEIDSGGEKLECGDTLILTVAVTPGEAAAKVIWDSSEPEVAAADSRGDGTAAITALKEGFTVITATAGGKTAFCAINVGAETDSGDPETPAKRGGGGGGCNGGLWSLAVPALAAPSLLRRRRK